MDETDRMMKTLPPKATGEENRALMARYQQDPSTGNRNRIVEANTRFVLVLAQRFHRHGNQDVPVDELFQAGTEGVIHAIEKFNPRFKVHFTTYAVPWITVKMQQAVRLYRRSISGGGLTHWHQRHRMVSDDGENTPGGFEFARLRADNETDIDARERDFQRFKELVTRRFKSHPVVIDIVRDRVFAEGEKRTLADIARAHGTSREWIRQNEVKLMPRIRALAAEQGFTEE